VLKYGYERPVLSLDHTLLANGTRRFTVWLPLSFDFFVLLQLAISSPVLRYTLIAMSACYCGFSQQTVALNLSSGSAPPGGVATLNLSLSGSASDPPAGLQWTLAYSPIDFSSASFAAGPSATAASKLVSCNNQPGISNCVLWGLNSSATSNGIVATVSLTVSPSTSNTVSVVQLPNAGAADPVAASLSASGIGGTVTISQTPGLNGFTCNPVSVTPPGVSTCTVALTAPALVSGATIALSSSSAAASVPPTVTIPAGATSTTFNLTSQTVSFPTPVTLTASYLGVIETFGLVINPTTAPTGTAAFVKIDTTTAGSWEGVYGADGFNVIDDAANNPPYVTVTPSGNANYIWASSTTDPRALQKASSMTDRIAACWFSGSSFSVDLNFTDANTHQVALYLLDWDDYYSRTEQVDILDANNTLLDSRAVTSFVNGEYLVWNLSGHVIVRITNMNGSSNAVLSGLFFGAAGAPPPSGAAAFVKTDTSTAGSWKGVYGADGFNVIDDTASYPSYVTVTPSGNANYVWASSTTDVRGLQKAFSKGDQIAACWYTVSSFTVDLNFNDANTHQVALYLLDWDNYNGRTERVDILDANHTLLDSRAVSSFVNGEYLVWNLTGHVIIQVTNTNASSNAVMSGLFFR
jgi:hypothetical protein